MYNGVITRLVLDRGFGFVAVPNQPDCFFHMKDLLDLEWGESLQERRVKLDIETTPKGARAFNVRAAE